MPFEIFGSVLIDSRMRFCGFVWWVFLFFFFFCFLGFLFLFLGVAGLWFGVDLLGFWVFIYRYIYIYIVVVPSLSELKIYAVLSRRVFNFWYDWNHVKSFEKVDSQQHYGACMYTCFLGSVIVFFLQSYSTVQDSYSHSITHLLHVLHLKLDLKIKTILLK